MQVEFVPARVPWRRSKVVVAAAAAVFALGATTLHDVATDRGAPGHLRFSVAGKPHVLGRFVLIEGLAQHAGRRVALEVAVASSPARLMDPDGLELRSVGAAGDALLAVLATAYRLPLPSGARMRARVPFAAYIFDGNPNLITKERVEFKLYHGHAGDPNFCELYLDFDLPHATIDVRERDPEYRKAIIALLSA